MQITGQSLIGSQAILSSGTPIRAFNPATGEFIEPAFNGGGNAEVDRACALAQTAAMPFRTTSLEVRANFLETVASEIESLGDTLIERCMLETALPRARLEGERGRTCGQLRLFADVVR
jgi:NADP-dependent aldehyde dehydrogenase